MCALISIAVIVGVAFFLAAHDMYEDGLFGKIFLGGMVLFGTIIIGVQLDGTYNYQFSWDVSIFLACIALFALRHAYRFMRWVRVGDGEWRARKHAERGEWRGKETT